MTAAVGRHRLAPGEHGTAVRLRAPDDGRAHEAVRLRAPDDGRAHEAVRLRTRDDGRGHEVARMRAKMTDPETARTDLAERLRYAHLYAERPPLSVLGKAVGYSKATLSKVLSGKMLPTWVLVRDLGMHLGVPPETVEQEWFPLWTAAHMHRSRTGAGRARAEVAARTGYTCATCGSWVVSPALHSDWHRNAASVAFH